MDSFHTLNYCVDFLRKHNPNVLFYAVRSVSASGLYRKGHFDFFFFFGREGCRSVEEKKKNVVLVLVNQC